MKKSSVLLEKTGFSLWHSGIQSDFQNLQSPFDIGIGAVSLHIVVGLELKNAPQTLKFVRRKMRMCGFNEAQSIQSFPVPERQAGAVETFLKESEVKSGVMRHQSGTGSEADEFASGLGENRSGTHHFIGDMMNRHHSGGDLPSWIDETVPSGDKAVAVDTHGGDLHDAVIDRAHAGGFHVEYGKWAKFKPFHIIEHILRGKAAATSMLIR